MGQFVGTVRNHFDNIVAFINRNLTNAVGEGLIRTVKIVNTASPDIAIWTASPT
jgi:transposase